MRRSLKARLIGFAALWIALALLGAWIVIGHVLQRFVQERFQQELHLTMEQLVAGAETAKDPNGAAPSDTVSFDTQITDPRFLTPLSGWYWQAESEGRILARSASLLDGRVTVHPDLRRGKGPDGANLVLSMGNYTFPNRQAPVKLILSAPLKELRAEETRVRAPLATSLAVLALGLGGAVILQVWAGMAGFRALSQALNKVRTGTTDHLPPPPVAELDGVVTEINALLAQNRAVVARTRDYLANLAHSLKTPLAALDNSLPDGAPAKALVARMDRQIGWQLRRARASGGGRISGQHTPVLGVVQDLTLVLAGTIRARGLCLRMDCEGAFAGERQDLEEMVGNLMENAAKWAQGRITVTSWIENDRLILHVADDGPGMARADYAAALSRGGRLDESGASETGLGLAIARDLALLNGGSLRLDRASEGGLLAALDLPGARDD